MEFKKGDLLIARYREIYKGYHFIIYLHKYHGDDFEGAIITTKPVYDNVLMDKSHFQEKDKDGNDYKIQYNKSHLVRYRFVKPDEWGPYKIEGRLTHEGVKFVDDNLNDTTIQTFKEYYDKLKSK